ncbi:MAG: AraC family transcriptional regulator [Oscillospiraceae bacterium]|jgi:AraC family transcriptional regulator|nr:AraC family transcriptional regulator [Oscillospiraceae bacterium]
MESTNWVAGLGRALNYIEAHITEELDYAEVARQAYSSSYHFQRVFSILCGCTLGEYIRARRLTLAGQELAGGSCKVIDAALKYGYESPDSFARAFVRFHGIKPSLAHEEGAALQSFSRLHLKFSLEGGTKMQYRIEEKEARIYTGYTRHFHGVPGDPADRFSQENDMYIHTRANQYILAGLADDAAESYNLIRNIDDGGYDFSIAALLPDAMRDRLGEPAVLGPEDARRFESNPVPKTTYAVFETERCRYPVEKHLDLRRQVVTEWLPSSGYVLAEGPEILLVHWFRQPQNTERFIELWLPVTPTEAP